MSSLIGQAAGKRLTAPREHPAYAGHFPGNPIVPGVLLLEWVREVIGRGAPTSVPTVKFLSALRPGESYELSFTTQGDVTHFRCSRGADTLVEGTFRFASEESA